MSVIPHILGWGLFAAGVLALAYRLLRWSSARGLLAAVVAGFAVRLAVMLVAHFASRRGIFYLDDSGYLREAGALAAQWRAGHLVNPTGVAYTGSLAFGYQLLLSLVFVLTGKSLVVGKLINVLMGTATIPLAALLCERVLGPSSRRPAAWLMALLPTAVWWSAVLLKEAFATLLLIGGLLAVTYWPTRRSLAAAAVCALLLLITRSPALIALSLGTVAALAAALIRRRDRSALRPLVTGAAVVVLVLAAGLILAAGGHPMSFVHRLTHVFSSLRHGTTGGAASTIYNIPKSLVSPYPWVFTHRTLTWDRALYPGTWIWYALLPSAAVGVWRLRRRPELLLLGVPIAVLLVLNALSAGFTFRQRSTIEPLLLILVIAGAGSWRWVLLRAAGALVVVAALATAQAHSAPTGGAIAAVAVTLAVAARWAPTTPFVLAAPETIDAMLARLAVPSGRAYARSLVGWLVALRSLAPDPRERRRPAPDGTQTPLSRAGEADA